MSSSQAVLETQSCEAEKRGPWFRLGSQDRSSREVLFTGPRTYMGWGDFLVPCSQAGHLSSPRVSSPVKRGSGAFLIQFWEGLGIYTQQKGSSVRAKRGPSVLAFEARLQSRSLEAGGSRK